MMTDPALARHVGARFDHVLVDEYQDTNRLQARILLALKPDGRGVTVVGDDAQAIYGFRAADVRNILDFPNQFGATARVIALERNYRSTQPILDASNALIARAAERHAKRLWTDQSSTERPWLVSVTDDVGQARWVADRVLERREAGLRLKSQAVLFRTSQHSAPLELELARRNIPFVKFGGLKFLEAAHIKDVLGVLRWAQNPRARTAGFRVAQLVAGIGPATARRLLDAMDAAAAPAQALLDFIPPPAAAGAWAAFAALYRTLIGAEAAGSPSTWPADLDLVQRWYAPVLQRLHDDAAVRQQDLDQLLRLAAGAGSRERFITELTLDPPAATSDEAGPPHRDDDFLILSTIHSAKGQEWQAVYVLNVVDGCIPADLGAGTSAELEEERRLLYVAMTRARHHLALLVPQRFYVTQQQRLGDRHVYGTMSRFIAAEVARTFDRIDAAAGQDAATAAIGIGSLPQVDVGAALRAAWQ
jgi:DNA helicase-2/ATP-dependent DNA helicase PcrA